MQTSFSGRSSMVKFALPIAIEIEPPRAGNGTLPDRRVNGLSTPRDIIRKADVN